MISDALKSAIIQKYMEAEDYSSITQAFNEKTQMVIDPTNELPSSTYDFASAMLDSLKEKNNNILWMW
jgi:hypothetical protein